MNADQTMLDRLSGCIIGCAFNVANTLGSGFLEKVYENALAFELRKAGNSVKQQYSMTVAYSGIIVGNYAVDLLVEEKVLVEIKATKALNDVHSPNA
jgi:GxxExxY protein